MTYVSRRTRITGSRWLDENHVRVRLPRKRSDARLKRHASCYDLRAWVNDSFMNYEHLLDLMSEGEAGTNINLCGRFIPVPVLVDILKNAEGIRTNSAPDDSFKLKKKKLKPDGKTRRVFTGSDDSVSIEESVIEAHIEKSKDGNDAYTDAHKGSPSDSPSDSYNEKESMGEHDTDEDDEEDACSVISLQSVIREKEVLEELLGKCLRLLTKATGKLEKIDLIVNLAQGDMENSRNEDIEDSSVCNRKSYSADSGNTGREISDAYPISKSYIKKVKDSVKCRDLLRKISGFRYKLKKIQDRRQDINQKILMSQQRMSRNSSPQVTELYNRKEPSESKKDMVKKLQKNMEKLIAEKGRLLSEMCRALNSLNSLKKSSKCSVSSRRKSSKTFEELNCDDLNCHCFCDCQASDNFESSGSDRMFNSQSSADSNLSESLNRLKRENTESHASRANFPTSFSKRRSSAKSELEEKRPYVSVEFSSSVNDVDGSETIGKNISVDCLISHHDSTRSINSRENDTSSNTRNSYTNERLSSASAPGFYKRGSKTPQLKIQYVTEEEVKGNKGPNKSRLVNKSKLRFICPDPKRRPPYGSMVNFHLRISSDDQSTSQESTASPRPSTSPTTKKEKFQRVFYEKSSSNLLGNVPQRRIKSETTMQEVEKALRNYEERLKRFDCLENKVQALRQKLAEMRYSKKALAKQKAEVKKARALESERSAREITRLCSENWDLKRRVEELSGEFEEQCRRIQSLKMGSRKAKELEVEAKVLRKELSGCRVNYEEQQKCIARLHSVVDVQRTEIENLMDHIRKLTMMHRAPSYSASYPEKRSPQKSRSFSPESGKIRRITKTKTQAIRQPVKSFEEDQVICLCNDNLSRAIRSTNQQIMEIHCFPPSVDRNGWT